ncbi:MAG: autotransporter-associated beta strand repeat-containing protein [Verrucomicrobiaceae bacterium]|nr:autotransporter-associated beta strand repeat-containing protein [Verrucomicrobiaceae bacterium]
MVWSGSGDGSTWNDTANWTGGVLPSGTNVAQFGTSGAATQIGLTSSQSLGGIQLASGSTIGRTIGSATGSPIILSLTGSVLLENLSSTQTLTLAPTVSGGTGAMSVTLGSGTITTAAGGIVIGANLSGTAFTKTGTGTLTLTGTNTYTGTLTMNAGTIQVGDGGSTGTPGNANIAINSGTSLVFNRNGTLATGVSLSGSGTLVQNGSGTVDLTSASTFSGPVNVNGGTLKLSGNGAIGNGAIAIASSGTLEVARDSSTYTMNNVLSGAGSLVKSGTGSLLLANPSSLTGTTTVKGGTLIVGATGGSHSLIGGGPIVLENAGTVLAHWAIGGSYTFANTISGLGGVTMDSGGFTATLSGPNTYTGPTTIKTGTLAVSSLADGGSTSGIGSSSSAATNLIINGGTLRYTGAAVTTDRLFSVGNASGLIDASGTGTVQFTNSGSMGFNSQTGARTLVLTGSNTGDNSLAAAIGDNSGATTISKRSAGTWVLSSASSTFTGGVNLIEGGTLAVTKLANGGAPSSIGAASNAAASLAISNNSTLRYTGSGDTTDRLFGIGAGGGKVEASGTGALVFTNTGAIGNGGANVARTFTLQGSSAADNTLVASLADMGGASSLAKAGTGKWVLTGNHTHSGGTSVTGGTLQIGTGGTSGSLGTSGIALSSGTSLIVNRSDALSFTQVISGSGSFTQAGSGTTTLSNNNTFTGTTTISSGVLQIGSGSTTGSVASTSIVNNGTLALNRSDNLTWTTPISGSGGFTKDGTNTVTLNASLTYTGPTSITAGKLQPASTLSLPSSNVTIAAAGTLAANGNAMSLASLNGAGTVENGSASVSSTITLNGSGSFTGLVRNGGAASLSLVKTGSGTQSLDNANTFTGTVSISGGTLSTNSLANGGTASGIGASSSPPANLSLNGGTLRYTGGTTSTDRRFELGPNGGTLDASGTGAVTFAATNDLSFTAAAGARTLTLTGTSTAANTLAARIVDGSSASSLVKDGSGTWALTNSNTYTGGTSLNDGVLSISSSNAIGSGSVTFAGGVLQTTQSMSIGNNLVVNNASNGVTVSTGVLTINGAISGSFPLYKDGPGRLIIAGTSNTVPTVVQSGTVQGSAANAGSSIALSTPAAVFEFNQSTADTYGGIISGQGGISLTGSGGLTLTGANTFDGETQVSGGVLTVVNNASLGSTTGGVSVQSGGTVELRNGVSVGGETIQLNGSGASGQSGALVSTIGTNTFAGSVIAATNASIAALPGSTLNLVGGLVKNGTVATLTGGGAITISGTGISGSSPNSDLVVDGSGTVVTLNTTNSYNGPTFVQNSGTLVLGLNNALPTSPRTDLSLTTGGTFNLNSRSDAVAGLSGDATGTVRNSTASTTSTLEVSPATTSTFSGVIAGTNGGTQGDINLVKTGSGTQVIDGANTYGGTTTISGGTLQIGSGGSSGQIGSGSITNNAELKVNRSGTVTLSQAITGSGVVTQAGSGTTVLTGNNTYSGGTTISSGTLRVGDGGLNGSVGAGAISNDGTLEIKRSNSVTLSQAITGSGSLVQSGTGDTTLSGNANSYSGSTVVSSGTLLATNTSPTSSATGSSSVMVETGARLAGTGRISGDVTFQSGSKLLIGDLGGNATGRDFEFAGALSSTGAFEARFDLFSNLGTGTLNSSLAADQVLISGSDRLIDLDIHLVLADPNSLLNWAAGDAWTLWSWGSISSGNRQLSIASLNAPALPSGLMWDTTQLNTTGAILIAYVPEPSRALLFLLALTFVTQRRRRS